MDGNGKQAPCRARRENLVAGWSCPLHGDGCMAVVRRRLRRPAPSPIPFLHRPANLGPSVEAAAWQDLGRTLQRAPATGWTPTTILALQRTLGNQAVQRLVGRPGPGLATRPRRPAGSIQRVTEEYKKKLRGRKLSVERERLVALMSTLIEDEGAPEWQQEVAGLVLGTDGEANVVDVILGLDGIDTIPDKDVEEFLTSLEGGPKATEKEEPKLAASDRPTNPLAVLAFASANLPGSSSKKGKGDEQPLGKFVTKLKEPLEWIAKLNVSEAEGESVKIALIIDSLVDEVAEIALKALMKDPCSIVVFESLCRVGFVERLLNIKMIGIYDSKRHMCHWTDTSVPLLTCLQKLDVVKVWIPRDQLIVPIDDDLDQKIGRYLSKTPGIKDELKKLKKLAGD